MNFTGLQAQTRQAFRRLTGRGNEERIMQQHAGRELDANDAAPEEMHAERVETDSALRLLDPVAVPADLQLRLRVAISHEQVRAGRRWTGRVSHRFYLLRENLLRPLAVHTAVASAALLLMAGAAATLGTVAPQTTVEANDIPLVGFSKPHFLGAAPSIRQAIASADGEALMVEARVDSAGRVYSYRILSGSVDTSTADALRDRMLTSRFAPARVFGEPVRGTVVMTFAGVDVRG